MQEAQRILVIEDDEAVRLVLKAILEDAGYLVEVSGKCGEALGIIQRGGIDLVISDVLLPGGGIETIIAQIPVPMILTSGAPLQIESPPSQFPFIAKPFRRTELLSAVESIIGRFRE